MIKKIFKWIFKILIGLILIATLSYGTFHLWEYATGSKYVKYLTENSETIPLDWQFSYESIKKDIDQSKLILVGEIHGFDEPGKFDVDFFKYLHDNHNVNHYVSELDYVQALLLNDYLKSGDEILLKKILKRWVVSQGRNNLDYFNKYRAFHTYYQQLPEDKKFEFIGVDKTQDLSLTSEYLNGLMPIQDSLKAPSIKIDSLLIQVEMLKSVFTDSPDTLLHLAHLASNLNSVQKKENRENVMFNNFYTLYKRYDLEKSKIYGFFGLYHVFQYRVNGNHPLASQIRKSDLGLENQMLSINFLLNDSHMVTPSRALPEFMRDEGKYTRMPVSADNMLFVYVYGIKDFKRMTPKHHKSFIKMNAENNPYGKSNRMNTSFQIFPVTDLFEMNDDGKPYIQYTIFVRNSDWAEPME